MPEQRELSLRLNAILEMVGASEEMRKFHQRMASIREIIGAVYAEQNTEEQYYMYFCGSTYEGTVTPDLASDTDMIMCPVKLLVHLDIDVPGLFLTMVTEDRTRPGYAKLQFMKDGQELTVNDRVYGKRIHFDEKGKAWEKHVTMGNMGNMHGPAAMNVDELGRHLYDYVLAYQCKDIPLFATYWIKRPRPNDWPPQKLINELKMMGCLFVGVGHYESPDKDLEWRASFSLQERILMKSLNLTQHRVYILLKMVKKNLLEQKIGKESLSSYHFKTCLFYTIEETPAYMWDPENLITCILLCLTRMLQWVRERRCPSFFLNDSNLFEKEGLLGHMGKLERLLGSLLQKGHMFLYEIKSDGVGKILKNGDVRSYRDSSNKNVCEYKAKQIKRLIEYKAKQIKRLIGDMAVTARVRPRVSNRQQDFLPFYIKTLKKLESGDSVPGYTQEDSQQALQYLLPWFHLCIGLEFAARAVTCPDSHQGKKMFQKVDLHLQQAMKADRVNARLAMATMLLRLEKLEEMEECFRSPEKMENCWTFRVSTVCPCTSKILPPSLEDEQPSLEDEQLLSAWRYMEIEKLAKYIDSCVIFERSHIDLVPPPLRYEMYRSFYTPPGSRNEFKDAWFDRAEVDAKVYLYLLQYLVCSKLNRESHKQIAMEKLEAHTQNGIVFGHRETAYNLLGWVYLQEDRVADAMQCFQKSWEIRPGHNAAKFHVLVESFRQVRARQQGNE